MDEAVTLDIPFDFTLSLVKHSRDKFTPPWEDKSVTYTSIELPRFLDIRVESEAAGRQRVYGEAGD